MHHLLLSDQDGSLNTFVKQIAVFKDDATLSFSSSYNDIEQFPYQGN